MPIKLVSYERFGMSTRLETEARSNSAMASLGLKKKNTFDNFNVVFVL